MRACTSPVLRCVVATPFLDVGGLDRVAALLARGLPLHGIETTVVHTVTGERRHSGTGDALQLDGVQVVELSAHDGQRWFKANRPDVISMHGAPDWLVAQAAEDDIPIIETLHGAHSFFNRETWPGEQLRSEKITGFVGVSELVRRQYMKANPRYPSDRIITIPNGVDTQHISFRDRTRAREWLGLRDEFLFVSLARYDMQKNTFGLVRAFSDVALACPGAHLLVAGRVDDISYFEQVRRLRDAVPSASRIHLRGNCPDAATVLAAADAFVLDSFFEGWSLASMEALFAGLPVVMSEVGGAREQVGENGSRGFVVGNPLGDPEAVDWHRISRARFERHVNHNALVEALCAIYADRNRWRRARDDLRVESTMRFSADVCLQRHAEVLKRAAARERLLSQASFPESVTNGGTRRPNPTGTAPVC
ncbi:glycosyltransferase [Bradyrhizobium sp. SBR1B]|uniref:glycosyltransferase n=1 Tax=Bradyrhizobium sp. SBR1B TaxID=2663836 RepID=UPI0016067A8E|nr:glycosyltransferase [Bradyrhizobium sp. SBR1B]